MPIQLPDPIAGYFAADRSGNAEAVAACFAPAAIVKDEGKTYTGRDAIRRWRSETASKYSYIAEPFSIESGGGRTVVTSHLIGDFPGSPVDLRYAFVVEGEAIAKLEIGV